MLEEIHSDRSAGVLVQEMDSTQILYALKQFGYFVMPLSEQMVNIQEESFRQYKEFDTRAIAEKAVFSLTPDAIGENNGWHAAGGLSRYNQCREGIIFQDSCEIWPLLSEDCAANPDTFSTTFESLRQSTYRFAESILEQIAIAFELPNPSSYFTEHGPLDVIGGSQFHVKKIVLDHSENLSCLRKTPEDGRYLTLRAHRDPSLISIVFHCPDLVPETCGAGLQFKDRELGTFTNIPVEQGDRAFCIVIAGSILELLTNGIRLTASTHPHANFYFDHFIRCS